MTQVEELTAPYRLEYPYKRGLGPVLGAFFGGLKAGCLLGVRSADGAVFCPPTEYHPTTAEAMTELVPLNGEGTLEAVYWIDEPKAHHPLDRPFAFARIRLDGADSYFVHAVDTSGDRAAAAPGLRVAPSWRTERHGAISDIQCFVPLDQRRIPESEPLGHLDVAVIPVGIDYVIRAGATQSVFLRHLERRRLVGRRSPVNGQVLIPPRGACTASGASCVEEVEVKSSGVVTTFSVIRIEFPGQRLKPPYVCAAILLDGADVPLIHLVGGDPDAVRMGMRVRAVWTDEPAASMEAIRYFEPTGEPDAPFEDYAEHL